MIQFLGTRSENEKGFTLVELMVVVAIIGILLSIAVPAYRNVTTKAEAKACLANQRIIEGAIQLHDAEALPDERILNFATDTQEVELEKLLDELSEYWNETPKCPAGGTYTIDINGIVSCDIPGHAGN